MRSLVAAVLLLSLASHKGSAWKRAVEGTCPVTQRIPHNGTGAVFQGAGADGLQSQANSAGQCSTASASENNAATYGASSCTGGTQSQAKQRELWQVAEHAGELLVRFRQYKMAERHHRDLLQASRSSRSWQWVERKNPAQQHPTDFAVLRIDAADSATIRADLERLPFVKDVHAQMRVTRSLVWDEGGDAQAPVGGHGSGSERGLEGMWSVSTDPSAGHIHKRPGRLHTKPSEGLDLDPDQVSSFSANGSYDDASPWGSAARHLLQRQGVPLMFSADKLWEQGFRGQGVKMGVFDTGIRADHPHVKNIRERSNWTHEPTLEDGLGHGTFVAGVIGGSDGNCPGFAPEVELYTFRVFTNDQVSYTSWFLDAFNYAMATEMNVVNLSIGGPDYLDQPFVEKVWEITGSGILMVSAIGNDGPLYGTLNNPADQNDVIGVGGIDYADRVAAFSSRGMSTWELPRGYGRAKPDVMAYGRDVMGSRIQGGCRSLSGTSVASPVVAGAVCLLASVVPPEKRWHYTGGILNPASMKQALVEGAVPIPGINMFEQGQGKLHLLHSMDILRNYTPRASVVPASLNLSDCPYMWPFCRQPLYAHALPTIFNATVLNGMGLTGKFEQEPIFTATNAGGRYLDVLFEYSDILWPWSGHLALYFRVVPEGDKFQGQATGVVTFSIVSPGIRGESQPRRSNVTMPIQLDIIPTPARAKRLLWDQFHSMRYPPAYIPRDALDVRNDILDWHGDHPHTNFHEVYDALREAGYFLEVLGSPLTCFDPLQYGALLVVDPEEEVYAEEVSALHAHVGTHGLGLLVFAEWYNVDTMVKMRFFDDNTRSWWTPATGGANIPALNTLLGPFGIAFGDAVLEGPITLEGEKIFYASGANIVKFPANGYLHAAPLSDKASTGVAQMSGSFGGPGTTQQAVLGLTDHEGGRIGVYGDSNCLDSSHRRSTCNQLLLSLLRFIAEGRKEGALFAAEAQLSERLGSDGMALPTRRVDVDLQPISRVLHTPLVCYPNTAAEFQMQPLHRGSSVEERQGAVTKLQEAPLLTGSTTLANLSGSAGGQGEHVATSIQQQTSSAAAEKDKPALPENATKARGDAAQQSPAPLKRLGGDTVEAMGGRNLGDRFPDSVQKGGAAKRGGRPGKGRELGRRQAGQRLGFWGRLSQMQLLPQVFAVVGVVGVFVLWHMTRRRRPFGTSLDGRERLPIVPQALASLRNLLRSRNIPRNLTSQE